MPVTTPILDILLLDTHNLGTLGVADVSQYPTGFTITSPSLEIIPPSFPVSTKSFTPNSLNIFNADDAGVGCSDPTGVKCEIPDGYWQLKYTVAPAQTYFVQKSFMRTNRLQRLLGQAFLSIDLDKCDEVIKAQDMAQIDQINYYLQSSIAAGNECNAKLAIDLYNIAYRMTNQLLKDKCFGGNNFLPFQ